MGNFTEFLLTGFSDNPVLQKVYATVFSLVYLAALTGNLLIMAVTTTDQHLQSPLYFFLKNLSFIDNCYISVTIPKSIMNFLTNIYSISFLGCALQVFFLFVLCGTEYALLLVMSYDRYAAICHPLHYEVLMNRGSCGQMVVASWLWGCIYGALHAAGTFSVSFCETNKVSQFFCEVPSLLKLACSGETVLEHGLIIASCAVFFMCFIAMLVVSYVHIFSTVLKIPSSKGRVKTLSTCLPHIAVVILFLFSGSLTYVAENFVTSSLLKSLTSLLYTVLPPTVNPVLYSLRNRELQAALRNMIAGK
ncbi:putative olfactory receptor 14L1 [Fukomys damarensis]|uniref:Olfactory receptor n=1 Tax=Fukomys damarensis TaxID=885580 RepID=A0A091DXJ0_FUKDA|nr:putative olfactory receptor 14L1 [Fukomys damarensis]KFO35782.1 Putative olfactory receptor 14L1 [Fukomys damarensis]